MGRMGVDLPEALPSNEGRAVCLHTAGSMLAAVAATVTAVAVVLAAVS